MRGLDAQHTGYALLPLSLGLFVMAPLGGYLGKHFRPKRIVQVGLCINVLALLWLRQVLSVSAGPATLIAPLLVYGVGIGLSFSQLSNITLSAVSVNESGEASGVNNTLRQVGSSFGTAIIGSIIIATAAATLASGVKTSTIIPPARRATVAAVVKAQSSNIEFGIPLQGQELTSAETHELKRLSDTGTVKANKEALLFTAAVTAAAFLLASQLPNVELHDIEKNESLAVKPAH